MDLESRRQLMAETRERMRRMADAAVEERQRRLAALIHASVEEAGEGMPFEEGIAMLHAAGALPDAGQD